MGYIEDKESAEQKIIDLMKEHGFENLPVVGDTAPVVLQKLYEFMLFLKGQK